MELDSIKTAFSISNSGNNMTRTFCDATQLFCNLVYAVTMGQVLNSITSRSGELMLLNYVRNDVEEVNIIPTDALDGEETLTKKRPLF
ncbi:hypothetical protein OUZ56_027057 [Daphnia magna]|uniref:Uncharacterized protein n=1 Tax=Daphnia magna TaxID=35525 RepID=A0ABQ9ZNM2_9CRUS|nr:hypothetical protein OUZ56_027057 [Daphnia magna]